MDPLTIISCPDCGHVLQFQSTETTLLPCRCGAVIRRFEGGVPRTKSIPILRNPSDTIRIGASGVADGKAFEVLGRIRCWFDGSVCHYWTILFEDASVAWLAEGYGAYRLLRRAEVNIPLDARLFNELQPGRRKDFRFNTTYVVTSNHTSLRWEFEGEVWMPESRQDLQVIEASAGPGQHLVLFGFLNSYAVAFDARDYSFDSFQWQGLRDTTPEPQQVACTQCKETIELKTVPLSQSFACPHCTAHHRMNREGHFVFTNTRNNTDAGPDIRLGTKGKISGTEYEVIGFALKEENNVYRSQWKEYVLYNRQEGFACLSEYSGHFVFLRETSDSPVLVKPGITRFTFDGEPFELYNLYTFTLINALGEFPNNLFHGRETEVREFISPPELWTVEFQKGAELTWLKGEHVNRNELAREFDFPNGLPPKSGVGAVEPKNYINHRQLLRMALIGALVLLIVHTLLSFTRQNRVVLDQTISFNDSTNRVSFVSDQFVLDRQRSNLRFAIDAPVDNSWFEINATLVNVQNGNEYSLEKGVEFYRGYSEGEAWSEGSTHEDGYLTRIPAGTYLLQIQGIRETPGLGQVPNQFRVEVTYDVSSSRNLWFSLLFLLVWPLIQFFRIRSNEQSRWSNSPFTPYKENQDED